VFLSLHLIDLCINIGSLSPILTTSLESSVGFYAAYFLCFAMFIIGLITLIYGKNNYIIKRPTGSPVFDALRIIWIRVRTGTFEAAKSGGGRGKAGRPWSDRFVEELKKALEACRVFVSRRRRPSVLCDHASVIRRSVLPSIIADNPAALLSDLLGRLQSNEQQLRFSSRSNGTVSPLPSMIRKHRV
jgi:hypothetical protein